MTKRIVFIGSVGSGKSTIVTDVITQLKKSGVNAEHVPEMIRYDIQQNGPMESIWEQYRTLQNQREYEDGVPDNVDFAIIDSGCLTPYFYACLYTSTASVRERLVLADMFKYLINDIYKRRYDYIFFLPGKLTKKETGINSIINDGTRYQSEEELETLDEHMKLVFTKMFKADNMYSLDGPLVDRADMVLSIIAEKKVDKS